MDEAQTLRQARQYLLDLPRQLEQGFTTVCFKPSMFVRSVDEVPALCRHLVAEAARLAA